MATRAGDDATKQAPAVSTRLGYRRIATELIQEIHDGIWTQGQKLPTEQALVDRFAVSRNTVREALRELRDFGYLSKRRGTPSVIVRTTPEQGFVNSIRSVEELLEYAGGSHNTLLSTERIVLMEEQARHLDCAPHSQWVRLQLLRRREPEGLPFCYSEVFVDPAYGDIARHLEARQSIYSVLEKHYGIVIARVMQDVEAAAATDNIALRLQVAVGSPIMLARTNFYSSDGKLVEIGMAHFATGRYRLRIALDRRRGQ